MKKFFLILILLATFGVLVKVAYAAFGDYWGARVFQSNIPVSTVISSYETYGSPAGKSLSYTDNGNNTVTDNVTGLMWDKTTGGQQSWSSAISYCDNSTVAGYTDWRLPNYRELSSIVSTINYNPSINTTYFPSPQSGFYWSSTTNAGNTSYAWLVYFDYGNANANAKSLNSYVRCVR